MKRIGLLSGTFDPIHIGHIEAALVSRAACELDEVLLLIEKKPHRKEKVSDYKHRKKMVELATNDFSSINFYEVKDNNITFEKTGKELEKKYSGATFVMIMGSDMLTHLADWPGLEQWLDSHELCVVLRENKEKKDAEKQLEKLHEAHPNLKAKLVPAVWSPVSSAKIKQQIQETEHADELHRLVRKYVIDQKLYI
jgi:nicotinate-nucleotide adenylyltransferase